MTPRTPTASLEPPNPQGWTEGLARQRSLGDSERRVIRIKETT